MGVTTHTSVRRGTRVLVILKNGDHFVDKFVERIGKGIVLDAHGFIRGRELRAMTIYRANGRAKTS